MRHLALLATTTLAVAVVAACSGSDDDPPTSSPPDASSSGSPSPLPPETPQPDAGANSPDAEAPQVPQPSRGAAQKGPFLAGSVVTACALGSDGTPDTTRCKDGSVDTQGNFDLAILPWTGATEITVVGRTFDEVRGQDGEDDLTLKAVVDAQVSPRSNVNLFSHFEAARIRALLATGSAFEAGRTQALSDLRAELGIERTPTQLEFYPAGGVRSSDDSSLLLFSVLAAAEQLEQTDFDTLTLDFADNGRFDGAGASILEDLSDLLGDEDTRDLVDTARANLSARYGEVGPFDGPLVSISWGDPCLVRAWRDSRLLCANAGRYANVPMGPSTFRFEPNLAGLHLLTISQISCASLTWTASEGGATIGMASRGPNTFAEARLTTRQQPDSAVTFSVNHGCAEDDLRFRVLRLSDGSPNAPRPLAMGRTLHTQVGAWSGSNPTNLGYYAVPVTAGTRQILVSGYTVGVGNPGMTVELFDGTLANAATAFQGAPVASYTANGQVTATVSGTFTQDSMLVRIRNDNAISVMAGPGDDTRIDALSLTPLQP